MANVSNRVKSIVVFLMFLILGLSSICLGYSGGDGSALHPYQISSTADWQQLCSTPADANGLSFMLTADLNLSGVTVSEIGGSQAFTGTFDGQGHTIYGFAIAASIQNYCGMFSWIGSSGYVHDLNISLPSLTATTLAGNYMGGLVGYNQGTIQRCTVTGGTYNPGYTSYIGCLAGGNNGHIENCAFSGDTTLSGRNNGGGVIGDNGGGLVGHNWGIIESCAAQGNVTIYSPEGGLLVGYNQGIVANCSASGTATIYGGDCNASCGGLAGGNSGTISGSYANVTVDGYGSYRYDAWIGGLVGSNWGGSTVSDCYATGSVTAHISLGTAKYIVGGLVGKGSAANIIHCYSTGQVSGSPGGQTILGGLVGGLWSAGTLEDSFWDMTTSGRTTSAAGVGKTTAEMKTLSTFTDAAWDFSTAWYMPLNGYPQLQWQSQQVIGVPDTAGLPQADAQAAITAAGLAVGTITNGFDTSVPIGNIISQTPAAGTAVGVGFVVNLVVSQGLTIAPDVVAMLQADAQSAIATAGLIAGTITNAFDPSVPAGHIISQNPAAGVEVFLGSAVDLVVSMGPSTTAPDVTGLSQADGESAIAAAGLIVGTITSSGSQSVPAGNIISQIPSGGTVVAVGSAVNLVISLGNQYAGGWGTSADPYQIASVAGFKQLCTTTADWNKHFILTANIDLDGEIFTGAPITSFSGTFDGNSHIISNFTISASGQDNISLFGTLTSVGQIKYLGVENASITGREFVGGLVGRNHGAITYCYAASSVSGVNNVGGLTGFNAKSSLYAKITSCYTAGPVTGTNYVGGLVGNNDYGYITICYSTGLVTGVTNTGGLLGRHYSGLIAASFWDTETSGRATSAGGTGKTTAQMKDMATYLSAGWSFISGKIKFGEWIMPAGDYPKLAWQVYPAVTLPNLKGLTEEQTAAALETLGVLPDQTYSVYDTSVAAGLVSETFPKSATVIYAGCTPVHILLAKETKYAGGDGVASPFQIANLNCWFDFMNNPTDWNKSFILTTDLDLAGLALTEAPIAPDTDSTRSFFQGTQFTGVFDGKGHTISSMTIAGGGKDYIGLFGNIGTGGQVKNLGVTDADIRGGNYVGGLAGYNLSGSMTFCNATGTVSATSGGKQVPGENGSAFVGGLIGWNGGTINSCHTKGTVNGGSYVGGLTGWNNRMGGIINRSYSTGNINGAVYVGGLVGMNYDTIASSYATGDVSGTSYVGGLTGWHNQGKIIRCYSTGRPTGTSYIGGLCGRVTTGGNYEDTANFWDNETSQIATSTMGTGKTTALMKNQTTFTDAGWDFVGETANGTEDVWRMCIDGTNYPRLTWALDAGGDWVCPDGVSVEDLDQLCSCWIETVQSPADIHNDDAVNLGDFIMLSQHWMMSSCGLCGGADITGDGNVNESDLTIMIDKWLLQENTDCRITDLNLDGKVDLSDYSIFAQHWLEGI